MLILQRKKQQSITIGDSISITILDLGNDWVKLAIEAPKHVPILRTELIEAASANHEAVSVPFHADSLSKIKDFINKQKNSGDT